MTEQVVGTQHIAATAAVALRQKMDQIYAWGVGDVESSHFDVEDVTWFNSSLKVKVNGHTFVATFADITDLVNEPPF